MSHLCQSLESEHRVIERVLNALEREATSMTAGAPVDSKFISKAITFVREFADGLHHQKEEVTLFRSLTEAGLPVDGGPVGVMLVEHDEGRRFIRQMSDSLEAAATGDAEAKASLIRAAQEYVALLRAHIMKEDRVLFPMADQVLDDHQKGDVRSGFDQAEALRPACDQGHRAWADSLG